MKIAIAGATGFVGTRLVEKLQERGDETVIFTRNAERGRRVFPAEAFPKVEVVEYDPATSGEWQQAVSGCDGVVNLAGASIADERWTLERKRELLDSRILPTRKLVEAIAKAESKPQVLVNTSAIGYYGTSETATFDESSPAGNDFLAQLCQEWEAEAQRVKETGVRLAILRFGIVLGMGGAIAKMLTPFKLYAGGPIGTGKQWFSWIHREDLVNLILKALTEPTMQGTYNATAPTPVRMSEFCNVLGKALNRPSWLPVPGFVLEAMLGDAAQVVLEGQQVLPKRALEAGFDYQYQTVQPAVQNVVQST